MNKKEYIEPALEVVQLHAMPVLAADSWDSYIGGDEGAKSFNNDDGFTMPEGGNLTDDDDDR